ncbi:MAG TPA: alkaline phosphatase D family protein [Gemmatimonadaceae bacterium]|jgi:hypothetical protein
MASTLPTVLAGPMVRRVEPKLASFWIALSDPSDNVTATIWSGVQKAGATAGSVQSGNAKVGSASVKTRRFGKRLNVALVVIKLDDGHALTPGTLYSYDIQVGDKALKQLGFLDDEVLSVDDAKVRVGALALGYTSGQLPSFVTPPPNVEQTLIIHGSCRSSIAPHYDALAFVDDAIKDNITDVSKRPQQLYLTGDQIYADDMADTFLYMLSQLADDTIGWSETIHVVATRDQSGLASDEKTTHSTDVVLDKQVPVTLDSFPPNRRLSAVVKLGGYTTSDGDNHLISYGEYVAMYLACWNPRVWSALGTPDNIFGPMPVDFDYMWPFLDQPENAKDYGGDFRVLKQAVIDDQTHDQSMDYSVERKKTEVFRAGIPRVARALANCATYMIFDDHDVTDDWNLSKKWQNRVYSKAFGRQLVRNAIMAYAVFQGWGNDPVAFETGNNKSVLDEIEKLYGADDGAFPLGDTNPIDILSAVTGTDVKQLPTWNYTVQTPKAQVIVLDTRTRRKFDGQGYSPPDLLGQNRETQLPAGPVKDGREVTFVISAAPVFGPDIVEQLAWPLAQSLTDAINLGKGLESNDFQHANIGTEKYDAEGWSSNDKAREDFLARLATYPSVVVLGGDVHFGYTAVMDYYAGAKDKQKISRIVQLTSSPFRNVSKPQIKLLSRQNPFLQALETAFSISRIAWKKASPIVLPHGAFVSAGRQGRMQREPSLLPADGWPDGTTIPDKGDPDWSWRITMQRDTRPDAQRPPALTQPVIAAADELKESNSLPGYRAIANRHQTMAALRFEFPRQIAFPSHYGFIKLSKTATDITLHHVLVSASSIESPTGAENTVHDVVLTPTKLAAPTLTTRGAPPTSPTGGGTT